MVPPENQDCLWSGLIVSNNNMTAAAGCKEQFGLSLIHNI
jgi:hypothetical protein